MQNWTPLENHVLSEIHKYKSALTLDINGIIKTIYPKKQLIEEFRTLDNENRAKFRIVIINQIYNMIFSHNPHIGWCAHIDNFGNQVISQDMQRYTVSTTPNFISLHVRSLINDIVGIRFRSGNGYITVDSVTRSMIAHRPNFYAKTRNLSPKAFFEHVKIKEN